MNIISRITVIATAVALIYISQPAYAAGNLLLKYDIYAGGFHVLEAMLDMSMKPNSYNMYLEAKTEGFIGKLFPWSAKFKTNGTNENGKLTPTAHEEISTWKNSTKTTILDYDSNGNVEKKTVKTPEKSAEERSIDKMLSNNSVDVLTGVLSLLHKVKSSNECNGKIPVFDGKRKFNINLKNEGREIIQPSRYSIFSGEAIKCTLTVEPVAGFNEKDKKRGWMAIQNHSQEFNRLPTIWLAKTAKSSELIPVKLYLASTYGAVVAHLTDETIKKK